MLTTCLKSVVPVWCCCLPPGLWVVFRLLYCSSQGLPCRMFIPSSSSQTLIQIHAHSNYCQYCFTDETLGNIFAFLKLPIVFRFYFSFVFPLMYVFLHLQQSNTSFLQFPYLFILFAVLALCPTHMLYIWFWAYLLALHLALSWFIMGCQSIPIWAPSYFMAMINLSQHWFKF